MSLKRSRSSTKTATSMRSRCRRASAWSSRSSASVRFGRPVSGSCSAAWRVTCSSRSRSTAMMISVATAVRNATSSSVNARGSRASTSRTPNGSSWPSIGTLRLLTTPSLSSVGDGLKRVSVARSSTIVGSPLRSVCQRARGLAQAERQRLRAGRPFGHADARRPGSGARRPRRARGRGRRRRRASRSPSAPPRSAARRGRGSRARSGRASATAFCWRARRASCCAARVRSVTSRATTSSGLDRAVLRADGHRLDGERQSVADELERAPLAVQRRPVVLEAELEHLVGDLGVELGHQAAAEHVRVEEAEAADRLAVGDEDPQLVIEQEDGGVRQVRGQRPVQRLGVADQPLGLVVARSRAPCGRSRPCAAKYRTPSTATVVQLRYR